MSKQHEVETRSVHVSYVVLVAEDRVVMELRRLPSGWIVRIRIGLKAPPPLEGPCTASVRLIVCRRSTS